MGAGIADGLALSGGGVTVGAASGGGAVTSGGVESVGAGVNWVISGAVAGVACAVSKACIAGAIASDGGGLSGLGVLCTALAVTLLIASAPEETGAPEWLPALKFSASSLTAVGPRAIAGAAAPGAAATDCSSTLIDALGAEAAEAVMAGVLIGSVPPRTDSAVAPDGLIGLPDAEDIAGAGVGVLELAVVAELVVIADPIGATAGMDMFDPDAAAGAGVGVLGPGGSVKYEDASGLVWVVPIVVGSAAMG